jgi:membrane protein implicated in regulation of membrane protease activity
MEGYVIQLWLVWSILAVLFMLGAWMRMGAYLWGLALAALIALVESIYPMALKWQIGSFIIASGLFFFSGWLLKGRPGHAGEPAHGHAEKK